MIYFFLGLIVGILILWWWQKKINRQLHQILVSLSQFEQIPSFSKVSQVKRSVNLFTKDYQYLLAEKELCQKIINQAPVGYLRIDSENHLIDCNKQAQKLLLIERWQPERRRLFLELVRSYELDQLIQQTRKTQQSLSIKWQFFPTPNYVLEEDKKKAENYTPIYLKASAIPLPRQEVAILIEDKQKIKELTQRREEAYTDLSHELRTPLTSMSLLTETLIRQSGEQNKIWLEQLYQEINRLVTLVENWLKAAQWDQNPYQNLEWQNLELKQLILSAWQSLAMIAGKHEIAFEYDGEEMIIIPGDLNYLIQVFVNLFDNAIKHSPVGGLITVEVRKQTVKDKDWLIINIMDQGSGFNEQDLPYIFERLYRGDKSRVRNAKQGSGLGLNIVKQIIEAHGGKISARNHPMKSGAWFQIQLAMKH